MMKKSKRKKNRLLKENSENPTINSRCQKAVKVLFKEI
jgi:hypothetical protein